MINETNIREYIGKTFRHFKGDFYLLLEVGTHSETEEKMAIYKALYGDCGVYVRPLNMFLSKVDKEKYPYIEQEHRFMPYTVKSVK